MAEIELPDGFQELKIQVAGHTFEAANAKAVGLLLDAKGTSVLKPLGKPECGERETKFYENLQKAVKPIINKYGTVFLSRDFSDEVNLMAELSLFVPKFYCKLELKVNQRDLSFLKMENLANGMIKPCIMDIKVGHRTWDPLATEEKRLLEDQKYLGCKKPLGLCLPGFQLYKAPDGEFIKHGKEYGKKLNVEGFRQTISMFLNANDPTKVCEPLIKRILMNLHAIRQWFHKQKIFRFYASSLLLVYDYSLLEDYLELETSSKLTNGNWSHDILSSSEPLAPTNKKEKLFFTKLAKGVNVKMIDFAHVFPSENNSIDINYLHGLENLINIIEEILKKSKKEKDLC